MEPLLLSSTALPLLRLHQIVPFDERAAAFTTVKSLLLSEGMFQVEK